MARSVQASAIDDRFESLTNAPDAWVSGPDHTSRPVHYQHYVDPGDGRSAVDDRCFTEYGGAHIFDVPRPSIEPVQVAPAKHHSRDKAAKSSSRAKRRPSPTFVIRGKNGESVVRSNPFVLRKSPQPRSTSSPSKKTRSGTGKSSQQSTHAKTYKIRIKGKNGEEVIRDIRRPLIFTSSTSGRNDSEEATLVGTESESAEEQSIEMPHPSGRYYYGRDDQGRMRTEFTAETSNLVKENTITFSSSPSSRSSASGSLKMSGAIPPAILTPTPRSSRSHLLPPSKPNSKFVYDETPVRQRSPANQSDYHAAESTLLYEQQPSTRRSSSNHLPPPSSNSTSLFQSGSRVKTIHGTSSACAKSLSSSSKPSWSLPWSKSKAPRKEESLPPQSDRHNQAASSRRSVSTHSSLQSVIGNVSTITTNGSEASIPRQSSLSAASARRSHPKSEAVSKQSSHRDGKLPSGSAHVSKTKTPPTSYYNWKATEDSLLSSASERSTVSPETLPHDSSNHSRGYTAPERTCSAGASRSSSTTRVKESVPLKPVSETSQESGSRRSSIRFIDEIADHKCDNMPSSGRPVVPQSAVPDYLYPTSSRSHSDHERSSRQTSRKSSSARPPEMPTYARSTSVGSSNKSSSYIQEVEEGDNSRTSSYKTVKNPSRHSDSRESGSRRSEPRHSESRRSGSRNSEEGQSESRQSKSRHSESRHSASKSSESSTRTVHVPEYYEPEHTSEPSSPPPFSALTTIREEQEPSLVTWTRLSSEYQGKTQYARAGAITPHPLSSVGRPETPKEPPAQEPAWQTDPKYQKPYVESVSSSSGRTRCQLRGGSDPQQRLLHGQVYHSARESAQDSGDGLLARASERRRRRTMERAAAGSW